MTAIARLEKSPRVELGQSDGYQSEFNLALVAQGLSEFFDEMYVTDKFVYGDGIWSWEDPTNLRLKLYAKSHLTINWNDLRLSFNLTSEIINDLKKFAFFRYTNSQIVFSYTRKNAHPTVVVSEVKALANFLSHLRSQFSFGEENLINKLCDIKTQDLRVALETYSGAKGKIKIVLRNLASSTFGKYLIKGPLEWNQNDIETLNWTLVKNEIYARLPEKLFLLLSNSAAEDVKQFLEALEVETHDKSPTIEKINKYTENFQNFHSIFDDYVKYRSLKQQIRRKQQNYLKWTIRMRGRIRKFDELVKRARTAAHIIIMIYTGARVSELSLFKVGCLKQKKDLWVMQGTVIKHRELTAPSEQDEWIAIPIVRDAVRLLEETARVTKSEYLFHKTHLPSSSGPVVASSYIQDRIKFYIGLIDYEGKWSAIKISPHQFRNSLVFEMRKAGLGLPFISYQLKHAYDAFGKTVSNTTLGYGSLATGAVQKAIADAHFETIREIYHPDAPIAGGGAEDFKRRRREYFAGMALQGIDADRVLRYLVETARVSLIDVGLGYCQGRSKILVNGVERDPDCLGQLRCNPVNCPNALIPEFKEPYWDSMAAENKKSADDPYFAYAREDFLRAFEEANSVVRYFQIERRRKKSD